MASWSWDKSRLLTNCEDSFWTVPVAAK